MTFWPASKLRIGFVFAFAWAVAFVSLPGTSHADAIETAGQKIIGRIVKLSRAGVTIDVCDGNAIQRAWTSGMVALINSSCQDPGPADLQKDTDCPAQKGLAFEVRFRNQPDAIMGEDIYLGDRDLFHITSISEVAHGPLSEVSSVRATSGCLTDSRLEAPKTYCVEPKQFAVNFSYDTPLPNHILTRGFSFYLETYPTVSDERSAEIREAIRGSFGAAINIWTSELWRRREHYDPRLSSLLSGMTSHSQTGFTLFVPPQVIALRCPQAATFVVRIFLDPGPFARPPQKQILAAVAAMPGRTILLNYSDYTCWKNALFKYVVDDETSCVNLVPILMHELGHAFGLGHQPDEIKSIMNPVILVTTPSDDDLDRLAAKLMEITDGKAPGDIPFVDDGVAVRLK